MKFKLRVENAFQLGKLANSIDSVYSLFGVTGRNAVRRPYSKAADMLVKQFDKLSVEEKKAFILNAIVVAESVHNMLWEKVDVEVDATNENA